MANIFQKVFGALLTAEQSLIPVFIKSPAAQTIAAVIFVTEEEILAQFGVPLPGQVVTAAPVATPVAPAPASAPVVTATATATEPAPTPAPVAS